MGKHFSSFNFRRKIAIFACRPTSKRLLQFESCIHQYDLQCPKADRSMQLPGLGQCLNLHSEINPKDGVFGGHKASVSRWDCRHKYCGQKNVNCDTICFDVRIVLLVESKMFFVTLICGVQSGAVKLVLWRHRMHLRYMHLVTWENQFHCTKLYIRMIGRIFAHPDVLIFVLRKKGSKTKKRMREEEIEKGDCGPPTRKSFFEILDLNQAVPNHLADKSQHD